MTYHARPEWATRTSTCTTRFVPSEVEGVAVHWNGPPVTLSPAAQLRADENYHMDAKAGCAIFYNLAVDQTGGVWEARGIALRGGANGDSSSNRRYVSICGLIGVGQAPTTAMYAGFRDAIALTRDRYPHATAIKTHNDVRPAPTACPGPDLTAAVRNGTLEPLSAQPEPEPPPVEEDEMFRLFQNSQGIALMAPGYFSWLAPDEVGTWQNLGYQVTVLDDGPFQVLRNSLTLARV